MKRSRREFGDIGDEVNTNLPVRKSVIPREQPIIHSRLSKKPVITKAVNFKNFTDTKTVLQNKYVHHINPVFYRDFVTVKKLPPPNQYQEKPAIQPLNVKEIHALNYLKGILSPKYNNNIKRNLIARTKLQAANYARSLRSTNIKSKTPFYSVTKVLENPFLKRAFVKPALALHPKQLAGLKNPAQNFHRSYLRMGVFRQRGNPLLKRNSTTAKKLLLERQRTYTMSTPGVGRSYINSRPGLLPYGFRAHPRRRAFNTQFSSRFLKNKGDILNSWRNSLYRRNPLREIDERRKYHSYHVNNNTANILKKAQKYKANTLLKDLSKVTMKWTGLSSKDSATVNASTLPSWFSTLRKAIQPKVFIKPPKNPANVNSKLFQKNARKETSLYPTPKIAPEKKLMKTVTETKINTDGDNKRKENPVTNKTLESASKKDLALYQVSDFYSKLV